MKVKFKTASDSEYELDLEKKLIRRLSGSNLATNRQGSDGDWKSYHSISDVMVGRAVLIVWSKDVALLHGSPKDSTPATITSVVVDIK